MAERVDGGRLAKDADGNAEVRQLFHLDNRNLAHEPLVQEQNSKIDLHYCLASMDHGSRVLQRWLAWRQHRVLSEIRPREETPGKLVGALSDCSHRRLRGGHARRKRFSLQHKTLSHIHGTSRRSFLPHLKLPLRQT